MIHPIEKEETYRRLEKLSDQELRSFLWKDFVAFGEEGPDLDLILNVTKVIQQRDENIENADDVESALAKFHSTYDLNPKRTFPKTKRHEKMQGVPPKVKRLVSTVAATACALIVFCAPVAHGSTILETMVNWKQSTFSPPNQQSSGTVAVLTTPDYLKVVDAVSTCAGSSLLPNWYPEDTVVNYVEENSSPNTLDYCISFSRGEKDFAISILVYDEINQPSSVYEKNRGSGSVCYPDSGMPYYLMKNLERSVAVWQGKTSEYCILGFLTTEEIQHMMNSIIIGDEK